MRKFLCFTVSAIFLAVSTIAVGADFWEKKKYEKWNARECAKMLTDSPWSQDLTLQKLGINQSARASDDGQQFYIKYQMQFRSALPIRQALVRQMQLAQNYDKLAAEQKQQFDQRANAFLATNFTDAIIVFVTYESNSQNSDRELDRFWQAQTTDLLKNKVFLRSSSGDRVDIAQYNGPQGDRSFQFIFPRQVNGEPLIKPEDKSLMLEFETPSVGGLGGDRGYLEFKPQKMVFEGNVAF